MRAMYTPAARQGRGIWVVPAAAISASQPDDAAMPLRSRGRQDLQAPTFYTMPEGAKYIERYDQQEALFTYCLRRGDDNLILSHRLGELCGHVRSWRRTSHWRTARSITSDKLATTCSTRALLKEKTQRG